MKISGQYQFCSQKLIANANAHKNSLQMQEFFFVVALFAIITNKYGILEMKRRNENILSY